MMGRLQGSTLRLIGIMGIIVAAGILIARSYYGNQNSAVDPRIREARNLYEQYDRLAQGGDYYLLGSLLDSISDLYGDVPHYRASFELGVLHNNRAAIFLTLALYGDSIPDSLNPFAGWNSDSLVSGAEFHVRKAISIYEDWNSRFEAKEETEIRQMIEADFVKGLEQSEQEMLDKYLRNRVNEITNSMVENQRRLSVCHTNLGLVHRLRGEYEEAVAEYESAITLWNRNLEAENNLNRLLGKPLKKRNIIQKLFPPAREISD